MQPFLSDLKQQWWQMITMDHPHTPPQPWEIVEHFDTRLSPLLLFIDPQTVYHVGLQCLGYPPTWIDTDDEAAAVEAAVMDSLRTKYHVI